jgi:hypothetical protein
MVWFGMCLGMAPGCDVLLLLLTCGYRTEQYYYLALYRVIFAHASQQQQ